ncbi:MAG TPA: DUF4234 domain-containing protein [Acidimicrobiales bacterium]|nr:DUF4234 domain-containing protein [Acidimicrobiales bacterium]
MAAAGMRRVGKTRNPWGVWALSLVTLGIYGLWWYYTINGELREYDPQIKVQPGVSLCALLFGWVTFGIATIVSIVRTGGRISEAQRSAGAAARCSGLVGLLLGCIGFWQVYYQSQLNKVWEQHGNPPAMTRV